MLAEDDTPTEDQIRTDSELTSELQHEMNDMSTVRKTDGGNAINPVPPHLLPAFAFSALQTWLARRDDNDMPAPPA